MRVAISCIAAAVGKIIWENMNIHKHEGCAYINNDSVFL